MAKENTFAITRVLGVRIVRPERKRRKKHPDKILTCKVTSAIYSTKGWRENTLLGGHINKGSGNRNHNRTRPLCTPSGLMAIKVRSILKEIKQIIYVTRRE